jgi:hypothetical protein
VGFSITELNEKGISHNHGLATAGVLAWAIEAKGRIPQGC